MDVDVDVCARACHTGSDAVLAAEEYYANGGVCHGNTSIEQIARVYGRQAVVVSVDPRYGAAVGDTCALVVTRACVRTPR